MRHALQHFKREDLPATKYQKPHFRPINIADADFGPCIETTMSYPTYHQKHPQESVNKIIKDDTMSNNNMNHEIKPSVLMDLNESTTVNSYDSDEIDPNHCKDSQENNSVLSSEVINNEKFTADENVSFEKVLEIQSEPDNFSNNLLKNKVEEVEKAKKIEVDELEVATVSKDEVIDNKKECNPETQEDSKPQEALKPESSQLENKKNKLINSSINEVQNATELPGLTEVSEDKLRDAEKNKVETSDTVSDNKKIEVEEKASEYKTEEALEPELKSPSKQEEQSKCTYQLTDSEVSPSQR